MIPSTTINLRTSASSPILSSKETPQKNDLRRPSTELTLDFFKKSKSHIDDPHPRRLSYNLSHPNLSQNSSENLNKSRCNHYPAAYLPPHMKRRSIKKEKRLLENSWKTLEEFQKAAPNCLDSPRLKDEFSESIKILCEYTALPLDQDYLKEHQQLHETQIGELEKELTKKRSEIFDLREKLKNQKDNSKFKSAHFNARLKSLESEVKELKTLHEEKLTLQKEIKELFKFDEGDSNHSIEKFYKKFVDKLTAFALSALVLSTGRVANEPTWKDDGMAQLFIMLNNFAQAVGAVGDLGFGAGVVIPLFLAPLLSGAEYAWDTYRSAKKVSENQHASNYFSGGLEGIQEKNQRIALRLAGLLRSHLRFMTEKGTSELIDVWLNRLCYNIMKGEERSHEEFSNINEILTHISKGKARKHSIETHAPRKWTTEGLFKKAGVSYRRNDGNIVFESCFKDERLKNLADSAAKDKKAKTLTELSNTTKYGYFFFTDKEAEDYKNSKTKYLEKKIKKGEKVNWVKDLAPKGPQIRLEDSLHISSPALMISDPIIKAPISNDINLLSTDDSEEDDSHNAISGLLTQLQKDNERLALEVQEIHKQLHEIKKIKK